MTPQKVIISIVCTVVINSLNDMTELCNYSIFWSLSLPKIISPSTFHPVIICPTERTDAVEMSLPQEDKTSTKPKTFRPLLAANTDEEVRDYFLVLNNYIYCRAKCVT